MRSTLIILSLLLFSIFTMSQETLRVDSLSADFGLPAHSYKDNRPLTVGVNFKPIRTGYISTIKFFKGDSISINYTLKIFRKSDKEELVSINYTSATKGWNRINIPLTVVMADTEYVATLYNEQGAYVVTYNIFNTQYFTPYLTVLDNGGKYIYANTIPEASARGSNYFIDIIYTSLLDTIFVGEEHNINIYVPTKTGGWALTEDGTTAFEAIFGYFPPPVDTETEINITVDSIRYKLYTGRYWRKWRINPDGSESLIDTVTIK